MPADLTVGQFVYVIRKRIKLSPEKAIFIFVDEVLPPTAALMSSIYEEHKDEDGYVFIPRCPLLPLSTHKLEVLFFLLTLDCFVFLDSCTSPTPERTPSVTSSLPKRLAG